MFIYELIETFLPEWSVAQSKEIFAKTLRLWCGKRTSIPPKTEEPKSFNYFYVKGER